MTQSIRDSFDRKWRVEAGGGSESDLVAVGVSGVRPGVRSC